MKKLLLLLIPFLLFSTSFSLKPTITWIEPQNNNYVWNNFTINVTTNINANCTYRINWRNNTVAMQGVLDGNNSLIHNTTIDYTTLPHGYNYSIVVNCTDASIEDWNDTSIYIMADYVCEDTIHRPLFPINGTWQWILGHNLTCTFSTPGYVALNITEEVNLNCNGNYINITGPYNLASEGLVVNNKSSILNCNISGVSSYIIHITSDGENSTIRNTIVGVTHHQGIRIEGRNIIIDNVTIEALNDAGSAIQVLNDNATIVNSKIKVKNCPSCNFNKGIDTRNNNIVTIFNNDINLSNGTIAAGDCISATSANVVNISNNHLSYCTAISGGGSNFEVTKNVIDHCINSTDDLSIEGGSNIEWVTTVYLSVINLTFYDNNITNSEGGITLYGCNHTQIYHNNLINISYAKMKIFSTTNVKNDNINIEKNFYGTTQCPLIRYGTDFVGNDSLKFYDAYACNQTNGWLTNSCYPVYCVRAPQINVTYLNGTEIAESDFYYYYDGDQVIFNISLPNYYYYVNYIEANLSYLGNDTKFNLTRINDNTFIFNKSLNEILNDTSIVSEPILLDIYIPYAGMNDTAVLAEMIYNFYTLYNINPLDNNSVAYYNGLGGDTTNWSEIEDFSNVSNLTFEIPNFGKIRFLESLNLLDWNTITGLINFSNNFLIDQQRAMINSSALRALNKSARITFYNVSFNGTQSEIASKIKVDGHVCSFCTNIVWNNTAKILSFDVPHWSEYEVDTEGPDITIISPKGTLSEKEVLFNITTNEEAICRIDTSLKPFDQMSITLETSNNLTHTKSLTLSEGSYTYYVVCKDGVNNTNNKSISFSISLPSGGAIIIPNETNFGEINESKNLTFHSLTKAKFKVHGEEHSLKVKELAKNYAVIEIRSEPIEVNLTIGETKRINFDNDDYYDLNITLLDIVGGYIRLEIIPVHEKVEAQIEPVILPSNVTNETKNETSKSFEENESEKVEEVIAEEENETSIVLPSSYKRLTTTDYLIIFSLLALSAIFAAYAIATYLKEKRKKVAKHEEEGKKVEEKEVKKVKGKKKAKKKSKKRKKRRRR